MSVPPLGWLIAVLTPHTTLNRTLEIHVVLIPFNGPSFMFAGRPSRGPVLHANDCLEAATADHAASRRL